MYHEQCQDAREHRRSNPNLRSVGADQKERWAGPVVRGRCRLPLPPSPRSLPTDSGSQRASVTGTTSTRMVIDKGSPLFEAMGGMHNVYINSTGEPALKKC